MRKAERTRDAIMSAARRQFAEQGYEAATIRAIAMEAGIDPAMVIRYYKNKDTLFAHVIDVDLDLPSFLDGQDPGLARKLVLRFLALWEDDDSKRGLAILLRTATTSEVAAGKVRDVFASQIVPFFREVVPPDQAERRAALVVSHLLGLALCRYILKLPPMIALDRTAITDFLVPAIDRLLRDGIVSEPGQPSQGPHSRPNA